ncbi:hypothetical protein ACMU_13185 [Actibacterium mucosum KCTC 23349]|uniref:Uncharacterized protein n=2 Tax=Actibacterium TaxID=1433986 RepID=A0A037ZJ23_9RHOB|nr:hypothetical protein ACMU_13185 [Actibacterium mucosum KCTC 23349]
MLAAVLGLSACASVDTATRNAPVGLQTATQAPAAVQSYAAPINITGVNVRVPQNLSVSEANSFLPKADIVWREDPFGNRHEQVQVIMQAAAERAAAGHTEGRPVIVDIQMTRFHALTERTRYTVGGTHDIHYYLSLVDAETGQRLTQPQAIEMEFKALGGARALEAMSRGQTQKVRITDHVVAKLDELFRTTPIPAQQRENLLAQY